MQKPKIIIIGRNYTSRLGMIRAVGEAGYNVIVIQTNGAGPNKDLDSFSKYVSNTYFAREPNRDILIETLFRIYEREGRCIIIPVDDYAASTIDDNICLLADRFLFPNVGMQQGAINRLMDKELQKELALSSGLKVAKGWTINIHGGQYSIPNSILYPCFPKPQISYKGNKQCMRMCSSIEELDNNIKEMVRIKPDCPLLVEEYKQIDKEFGVLGFCHNDEVVVPGLVYKRLIGEGSHKGVTKLGEVTPLNEYPTIQSGISRLLKSIHFTGLVDIDLYESKGEIYFNELNLRFGAFGYSILCSGVNLPKMFIDTTLNNSLDYSFKIRPKTVCVSEKVNLEDLHAGQYGFKKYRQIDRIADFRFIADPHDPMPYILFRRIMKNSIVKGEIKYIIKRVLRRK